MITYVPARGKAVWVALRSKYEAIRDEVFGLADELVPGTAIPPERELCERFGVSRMTLRRAVDDLVAQGLLERHHGRGTFVVQPKIAQPLTMTSFSEDMRRRGFVPGSRTLSLESSSAGARLARRLEVSPAEELLCIRRLRLADQAPMAIETLYVRQALVPGLSRADLDGASFYDLLRDRYGVEIASGFQTIEPTVTNDDESELLSVPLHSPAFLFERTTRTKDGAVIEYVRSVYRGDRYQLQVELQPPHVRRHPSERVDGAAPPVSQVATAGKGKDTL